jgi:ppGpp synthetase/RelA/SpoT-type nucleotidyltranferase
MIKPNVDNNNQLVDKLNDKLKLEESKLTEFEDSIKDLMDKKELKEMQLKIKSQMKIIKKISKEINKVLENNASNNITEYINSCFVKRS